MTTYAFPSVVPSSSSIELVSNTAAFVSQLSGATQTGDRGGERWMLSLTFLNLTGVNRGALTGFLGKLNGQQHRFTVHNHGEDNQGALSGTPLVDGGSQTGKSVLLTGCGSVSNWIRAGDFFSIGGELKMCTADANSSGGACTVNFIPRIRTSPSNGSAVTTSSGLGTFMLQSGSSSWNNKPGKSGKLSDLVIKAVEDITA